MAGRTPVAEDARRLLRLQSGPSPGAAAAGAALPPRQFRIHDEDAWEAKAAVIDAWGLPTRALTELSLNRTGAVIEHPGKHAAFARRQDVLKRFHAGFEWQDDDGGSRPWTPQALTGDADSRDRDDDSRKWLAISWHNAQNGVERGMRLSFIDVTDWHDPVRYRHVLLVNPVAADDTPSRHESFAAIPAHAGGVVWFRDYAGRGGFARLRRRQARRRARLRHEANQGGRSVAWRLDRVVTGRRDLFRAWLSLRVASGRALCAGDRRRRRAASLVVHRARFAPARRAA